MDPNFNFVSYIIILFSVLVRGKQQKTKKKKNPNRSQVGVLPLEFKLKKLCQILKC